ncbi:MAG: hypothetical protein ABIO81_12395 [Ginsengibacter sp.]
MTDTKKISQPSQGSEDLGRETNDDRSRGSASAGTDTQLHLAALSGKKNKNKAGKNKNINDDEKVVRHSNGI